MAGASLDLEFGWNQGTRSLTGAGVHGLLGHWLQQVATALKVVLAATGKREEALSQMTATCSPCGALGAQFWIHRNAKQRVLVCAERS